MHLTRGTLAGWLTAALLTACGGSDGPPPLPPGAIPMPDVENLRLDAAKSDLAKAGLDDSRIEVVGGGALGVVNQSNWYVCDQKPDPGRAVESGARLLVDREGRCGKDDRLK